MKYREYIIKTNTSLSLLSSKSGVALATIQGLYDGTLSLEDCRLRTVRALAKALGVPLIDLINGTLKVTTKHRYIKDSITIDSSYLFDSLKELIQELEKYDLKGDEASFYETAKELHERASYCYYTHHSINYDTYEKITQKYPTSK